jgi:NADPH:quinone reductase-like Zn-dependent oxidoreductase
LRAIVCRRYGPPDVLQLEEVEKPSPKRNEVLVRVHATTAARGDCELRSFRFPLLMQPLVRMGFGFRGPRKKILGQELSGEVESVGEDVARFRPGDQVFAFTGFRLGAYAEYDCLPEKSLMATKPSNMTFEEAAAVPVGGLHAVHFLSKAGIEPGQKVMVVGAGGSIGTFAVQIAKAFGAGEVTGVDSANKLQVVRSIGADEVIDYGEGDYNSSGETYDVIFDTIGKSSFAGSMRSLKEGGLYLLGNPGFSQQMRRVWTSKGNKKVVGGTVSYEVEDLVRLRELIEAGKVKSVIDRRYPLEQAAEAHRYVDTGQKTGNVVMNVRLDPGT